MRSALILFFLVSISSSLFAQTTDSSLNNVLRVIQQFREKENKRDSILGHFLGSNTTVDFHRRYSFYDSVNRALKNIDRSQLSFNDQVNLELLQYTFEDDLYAWRYRGYLNPILSDAGFHTSLAGMGSQIFNSKKDCEDYIRRLKDIPRFVGEYLDLMREGLRVGISQPRNILTGYENTYQQHIVSDVTKSVFWKPFTKKPFSISDDDWNRILDEARNAVMNYAVTGFVAIKNFFDKEYLPKTKKEGGISSAPDGLSYYNALTHYYTTTDYTPEEIYQLGLKEVDRIKKEMEKVKEEAGFKGSIKEFIHWLRTEPKFYVNTPEQLLKEAAWISKKADGQLPKLFKKLPRQPYDVEPVPSHLAPTYTAGRYSGANIRSKNSGHYWVNTYDLPSRPLYALEALTLHEAVPGHHLQISLTQELDILPDFRRNLYVHAFGEGWGLYSEYLGHEMGFYKDPYSLFGRFTYEMWRACRLVLDVALHTKGWTREQAVEYLAGNTALSLHEVNTEINRYISWPGQALAYKMGEIKIKELRQKAEDTLKEKFDIRDFHDLILSQGTVTLKIMETMVDRWIAERKAAH